ncbi:MAG: dihydropteroate synthase [Actinomycetota bacterium]|nr:dihydropteroate synthase [Actinomycetota bacterium]
MIARTFPVFGARPWVMGILNVTPDSFSDGGLWDTTETAVARGRQLVADGADIVDVGGESTRPGAHRIDLDTELQRVLPVITELAAAGIVCSVDTTRSAVAAAVLQAGPAIVNDVSGGLADPEMAGVVADAGAPWVLMHWRGHSDVMQREVHYSDVAGEVRDELLARVDAAVAAGVDERSLILDAGLGFAKNGVHNWQLVATQPALVDLGLPVLLGTSRKSFLGALLAADDGSPRPPSQRDVATAATSLLAAQAGVWGVRVHEPRPTRDALAVLGAVQATTEQELSYRIAARPLGEPDAGYRMGTMRVVDG